MTPAVVGVGNAHVDRTHLVTSIPGPDEGAYARESRRAVGGVAANVATGLARLGHEAGIVARLGDDGGQWVRGRLAEELDVERVRLVPGEDSSYTVVLRTPEGERAIIGGGESSLRLRLRDRDCTYLADASVAVTSGYAPAIVLQGLLDRAIEPRPAVAFDLGGSLEELRARGYTTELLDRLLPRVDLFVGSRGAVADYAGAATVDRLRERGIERGAITDGADGARLWDGDAVVDVPGLEVPVEDTTGAGDAFTAALIDAVVCADRPLAAAGRFAAAAAGLACTVAGARAGLPTRAAIETAREDYSPAK